MPTLQLVLSDFLFLTVRWRTTTPFMPDWAEGPLGTAMATMTTTFAPTRPATTTTTTGPGPTGPASIGKAPLAPVVKVRKHFPESWIWADLNAGYRIK